MIDGPFLYVEVRNFRSTIYMNGWVCIKIGYFSLLFLLGIQIRVVLIFNLTKKLYMINMSEWEISHQIFEVRNFWSNLCVNDWVCIKIEYFSFLFLLGIQICVFFISNLIEKLYMISMLKWEISHQIFEVRNLWSNLCVNSWVCIKSGYLSLLFLFGIKIFFFLTSNLSEKLYMINMLKWEISVFVLCRNLHFFFHF